MYYYQPILPEDIFKLDFTNLDPFCENFTLDFYLAYISKNPSNQLLIKKKKDYNIVKTSNGKNLFKKVNNPNQTNNLLNESDKQISPFVHGYIFCKKEYNTVFEDNSINLHVSAIGINPNCRRLGLAKELMKQTLTNGLAMGAKSIDLFVRSSNKNAIKFYKKIGYEGFKIYERYYDDPNEDGYVMVKYLNKSNL